MVSAHRNVESIVKSFARKVLLGARPAIGKDARRSYDEDLRASGLVPMVVQANHTFQEKYGHSRVARGQEANFGSTISMATQYYYLVRAYRPELVVETGVCNGLSTALVLQALEDNGRGELHSIDYPEVIGDTGPSDHWSGKGGAAIPPDKQPGWLVPERLRSRWHLVLGKSTDRLRPLLESIGPIDCFIHDSEHSYECMMFEYSVAWKHTRPGGIVASNDIDWNRAFFDFCLVRQRLPLFLTPRDAFVVK